MQRYTNWSLIVIGAAFAALWVVSPFWIPEVQPLLVDDNIDDTFECAAYVSAAECEVLQDIFDDNPAHAVAQQTAMDPENDFPRRDPEPQELAEALRSSLNISDSPIITEISRGVFAPPRDAIHNARGRAQIFRITTPTGENEQVFLRLDSGIDGDFTVNNGPGLNLRIYLSRDADPQGGDEFEAEAVEIGQLTGNIGRQNYQLPDDLEVLQFRSLVIYNPEFDQVFGVAEFVEPVQ
jgi:hypothetical protein